MLFCYVTINHGVVYLNFIAVEYFIAYVNVMTAEVFVPIIVYGVFCIMILGLFLVTYLPCLAVFNNRIKLFL